MQSETLIPDAGPEPVPEVVIGATPVDDWFRLLRSMLIIVLPVSAAGVFITTRPFSGNGPSVGTLLSLSINLVVQTSFWVSLVYAYIDWRERTGQVASAQRPTLSVVDGSTRVERRIPSSRRVSLGEITGPAALWICVVAFTFGHRRVAPLDDLGRVIAFVHPDSWPWAMSAFGWMAANVVACLVATFRMGRWTPAATAGALVASVSVSAGIVWMIVSGRWLSPAYVEAMEPTQSGQERLVLVFNALSLTAVLGATVWTAAIALGGRRRDKSAPPFSYG